jgi:hypothetical protein
LCVCVFVSLAFHSSLSVLAIGVYM